MQGKGKEDNPHKQKSRPCGVVVRWIGEQMSYICIVCPQFVLGGFICVALIISLVSMEKFEVDNLEEVRVRIEDHQLGEKLSRFFDGKVDVVDDLESELKSGELGDPDDVEAFEGLAGGMFRKDQDLFALYMTNYNRRCHKLSREYGMGIIATEVRVYVNSTYSYRYDRKRMKDDPFRVFNRSEDMHKLYLPFQKEWYQKASAAYPDGVWEPPTVSSSEDDVALLRNEPIITYLRKVEWKNSSRYSVFKIKIHMENVISFFEDFETEYLKFVILDPEEYSIVGYRNFSKQVNDEGNGFKKIWELTEDRQFSGLTLEVLEDEILSGLTPEYFHFTIPETGWIVLCHFDKYRFQSEFYNDIFVVVALSVMSLGVLLLVFIVNVIVLVFLLTSTRVKTKEVEIAKKIITSISVLDFDSPYLIELTESRSNSKLMRLLRKLCSSFLLYKRFIPEYLYSNLHSMPSTASGCISDTDQEFKGHEGSSESTSSEGNGAKKYTLPGVETEVVKRSLLLKNLSLGLELKEGVLLVFCVMRWNELLSKMTFPNSTSLFRTYFDIVDDLIPSYGGVIYKAERGRIYISFHLSQRCSDVVHVSSLVALEIQKKLKGAAVQLMEKKFPVPNILMVAHLSHWFVGNLGNANHVFYSINGAGMQSIDNTVQYVTGNESILFDQHKSLVVINEVLHKAIDDISVVRIIGEGQGKEERYEVEGIRYDGFIYHLITCRSQSSKNSSKWAGFVDREEYEDYNCAWKYFVSGNPIAALEVLEKFLVNHKEDKLALRLKGRVSTSLKIV